MNVYIVLAQTLCRLLRKRTSKVFSYTVTRVSGANRCATAAAVNLVAKTAFGTTPYDA